MMRDTVPMKASHYLMFAEIGVPLDKKCSMCHNAQHSRAARIRPWVVFGFVTYLFFVFMNGLDNVSFPVVLSIPVGIVVVLIFFMASFYLEYRAAWRAHHHKAEIENVSR